MCKKDGSRGFSDIETAMMQRALALAKTAWEQGEVPVGAIVYDSNGNVVGEGHNATIQQNDMTAHAEIIALRRAAEAVSNYRLSGYQMAVTLEPCVMCVGAVLHARLSQLIYAAADPKTGACGSVIDLVSLTADAQINHQTQVRGGLLAQTASAMLKQFFSERRGG